MQNKFVQRLTALLLSVCLVFLLMPVWAFAADSPPPTDSGGDVTATGEHEAEVSALSGAEAPGAELPGLPELPELPGLSGLPGLPGLPATATPSSQEELLDSGEEGASTNTQTPSEESKASEEDEPDEGDSATLDEGNADGENSAAYGESNADEDDSALLENDEAGEDNSTASEKPKGDEEAETATEAPDALSMLTAEDAALLAEEVEPLAVTASGYCGDPSVNNGEDVSWSLDDAGTLTISGSGAMGSFFDGANLTAPWLFGSTVNTTIKTVIIQNGVTTIGDGAFAYCINLTSVAIPDSVTSIEMLAFALCQNLFSAAIPNSVTFIGTSAFNQCATLTSITIPDGMTTIEPGTFRSSGLSRITIPSGITSISDSAFNTCQRLYSITFEGVAPPTIGQDAFYRVPSIGTVHYPEGADGEYTSAWLSSTTGISNWLLTSASASSGFCGDPTVNNGEDVLWQLDLTTGLLTISGSGAMADYTEEGDMPWAPYRGDIQAVTIEDGITTIGDYAFCPCACLTNVTIPDSVTAINEYAFSGCMSLTNVTIPESVTTINEYAFSSCMSLTGLTIPDSVLSIGACAFYGCNGLTSVVIPGSVATFGENAFSYCSSLARVTFLDGVTTIGSSLFINCDSLTTVVIPDSVTSIGESAFSSSDSLTSIVIPDSVTSIGARAFMYCLGLADITLPSGVTTINEYTFSYCENLTSIIIPENITSIGSYAFQYCTNLTNVTFMRTTPPAFGSASFRNVPSSGTVHYPEGAEGAYTPSWLSGIEYISGWTLSTDSTPPVLTEVSSERTGKETATITFQSNEKGFCYYGVVTEGADEPVIETRSGGTPLTAETDTVISLAGITDGASRDVWILVKDPAGNIGRLKVTIAEYIPINYPVTSPFGIYEGSGVCTATIDASREIFLYLEKNGELVDDSHYTITSGSTIITLTEDYLCTLNNGEHLYRAVFSDGFADLQLIVNVAVPETDPSEGSSAGGSTGGSTGGSSQTDSTGTIPHTGDSYTALVFITLAAFMLGIPGVMIGTRRMRS